MGQAPTSETDPAVPPRRARAPRGEGHRLRSELVDAASDLLADLGDPNQLSIRAVAAAVGVTPPSIYRHFADKQALLVAVLSERWAEFHRLLVGAASESDDPFDSLRRFCLAYLAFAEERPGHYRTLFSAAAPAGITDDPAQHPGAATFLALVEAVQRCLDEGAPAQPGRDSWFLALQVWLSGHGLVDLRIGQRFPFPWPPAEVLLDAMLADLGLSRAGPHTHPPATAGMIETT
ncbi:MAG: TetR/AcrR family transcriptional regulator [Actinobacteria bacterium]|nr:TetR/AcrR family transcriptional regulator [Actinomycetota bacterium]